MTKTISDSLSAAPPARLQFASLATATVTRLAPDVTGFYDAPTGSIQYVVADPLTRSCAVIDPVLDFDPRSGSTRTTSADRLLKHIEAHGLTLEWILDTHPHADHFSAAGYLKDMTGASTGIGERVVEVQRLWKAIYNLPDRAPVDGSQWDRLFADGERFTVGETEISVLLSLGHTLCSVTYVMGNAAFVHDTLFMPDSGTARADFPRVFSAFCSCRATHASSRGMTTVQTAGRPLGRAPLLPRGRTICM
jgi:glyoxylase-like metal-dependent hydrolase (beta-lactamase superfamily II)